MKKTILAFLLTTIITFSCLGQNDISPLPTLSEKIDTLYMNDKWEPIPKGAKYSYFRTVEKDKNYYCLVKDYYENGQLQMSGTYKTINLDERVGEFIWYTNKGEQLNLFNYQKDKVSVESNEYGFKVDFPKEPYVEVEKEGEITECSFLCEDTTTQTACGVFYVEYPNKSSFKDEVLTKFKKGKNKWKEQYAKQFGKIVAEKDIEFKGYPGKEIKIETKVYKKIMIMRFYLVTNKIYGIIAGPYSIEDINNPVSRFLNSFDIIDTTEWFQYKSNELGFNIEFPKAPEIESKTEETRFGKGEMTSLSFYDSTRITPNSSYFLNCAEFPFVKVQSYTKDSLSNFFKQRANDLKDIGKIILEEDIEFKGFIGKNIIVKRNKKRGYIKIRLYLIENKIYTLGIFTKTEDSNDSIFRFFNSFDIIKNK